MARAVEKQAFTSTYPPIREHEEEGSHDYAEEVVSSSGCCCCFGTGGWKSSNQESKYLLQENNGHGQYKQSWFVNKLKKVKEFSEVVAGPRWKNLVRKIGKYFKPKKSRTTQCLYSPQSYALNFDDSEEAEDDLFFSFSSRFSAPLSSNQQRTPATSR